MEKQNKKSTGYLFCLAVVCLAAFLLISTGTAYARYRSELNKDFDFEIREPSGINIGTFSVDQEGKEMLDYYGEPVWKTDGSTATLDLLISNGVPGDLERMIASYFSKNTQKVTLNLIGGLGLSSENGTFKISLSVKEENMAEAKTANGIAKRINEGTFLHYTNGDGWQITFPDEKTGEEIFWVLEGGKLSYIKMTVTVDTQGKDFENVLIQPRVYAKVID